MKYTDAHCHILTSPHRDIAECICDATTESDWDKTIENSNSENIFACIGVHPWFIHDIKPGWESRLYDKLVNNQTVMVGEIGLDKHKPDIETQIRIFTTQLEIASELRRPLHLHCVGAWDKILHIFKTVRNNMPPVILAHRFNDDPKIIEQIVTKCNMYFSYSAESSHDIIRATPTTNILMESDAFDIEAQIKNITMATDHIAEMMHTTPDEISE